MSVQFDKRNHIVACRRLPRQIDIAALQHEVAAIPAVAWTGQRAPVHRETVSVFLKGYPPMQHVEGDPERPPLSTCPYIRRLIYGLLRGNPGKCLLASLQPRGIVYPHTDAANGYFIGSYRIHIPVFTNPEALVFCNGRFFHMRAGEIWLINNLAPHAVINDHPTESRIHLIYDVFPDEETVGLIDSLPEEAGITNPSLLARLKASVG
ncbi:MAG: aspartyl/asparaginyl beta-hydroxylase domain-containing protein [Gammaproteobacteria bacterium]|nr:aspartyl/asparaginyl beta-hydroxylase domain-containing protein [Gammaproteobacteria bacterium]